MAFCNSRQLMQVVDIEGVKWCQCKVCARHRMALELRYDTYRIETIYGRGQPPSDVVKCYDIAN